MRIVFFGTYDTRAHPRVRVLCQGFAANGDEVRELNRPLGFGTEARLKVARRPWLGVMLAVRVLAAWARLVADSLLSRRRDPGRPDAVVIGYMGQFDVHLARLCFPRTLLVLDHMASLGGTVRDRGIEGPVVRILERVDRRAIERADVICVDTQEHGRTVSLTRRSEVVVVPVGAPSEWFRPVVPRQHGAPLRVVFFGTYTPLQGAPVIGRALRHLSEHPIEVTMIGTGQDLEDTRDHAGHNPRITWIRWVDAERLPQIVAEHQVCLGIFGTGSKAQRVVPNKVYQGAAAGCAIVTSDTPPQRRALGDAGVYVPAGDHMALADTLVSMATDPERLHRLRGSAASRARENFQPVNVVAPLRRRIQEIL